MAADCEQINLQRTGIHWKLPKGLHSVTVKEKIGILSVCNFGKLSNEINSPYLVVYQHDAGENGVFVHRPLHLLRGDASIRTRGEPFHLKPLFFQFLAGGDNGRVLIGGDDHLVALPPVGGSAAQDSQVVGLSAAGCEIESVSRTGKGLGKLIFGSVHDQFRLQTLLVQRGGVAVFLGHDGIYEIGNSAVHAGSGAVVQVYAFHVRIQPFFAEAAAG